MTNNVISNRLDVIREVVKQIDFEAYQDLDGKIIVKPPLYNLDVVNLGPRTAMTTNLTNDSKNSLTNPATAIYPSNNPFVIPLAEILTEQESEDQAAIRRTRTTVRGNVLPSFQIEWANNISPVAQYIDVGKLAKFGLREEPLIMVPWIPFDKVVLFAHAAAETARANRGYRTYTFTIPMRPELKLGFPVFIPHRDMYAYIKSITLNFQIGGTATMTVSCDSIRRRVLVLTAQPAGTQVPLKTPELYTPAPNLIYKWVQNAPPQTSPGPSQSPDNQSYYSTKADTFSGGVLGGISNNSANPSSDVGSQQTVPLATKNADGSRFGHPRSSSRCTPGVRRTSLPPSATSSPPRGPRTSWSTTAATPPGPSATAAFGGASGLRGVLHRRPPGQTLSTCRTCAATRAATSTPSCPTPTTRGTRSSPRSPGAGGRR